MRLSFRALLVCGSLAFALGTAMPASASESLTDINVTLLGLKVNTEGEALVSYRRGSGRPRHVLAWGAINALAPTDPGVPQVRFRYDYAGGWGKYRDANYWKTVENACGLYTGPALPYLLTACTAPDGSHWALQSWQRLQPLLGFDPWLPRHTAWELHLSHWSGELPVLELYRHFTYGGQFQGLFGKFTYLGAPVHGFSVNKFGNPYDRYARNVYIDTFNSPYGPGWKRESGILTHKGTGTFCHSFVPQKSFPGYPSTAIRPAAPGERYRATVMGPGVTPVVQWEGPGLTTADRALQSATRAIFDRVMAGDRICASERTAS